MANTKITSNVIADNAVGITQLNVSDGSNGQALVTNGSGTLSFASVGVSGINSSADATAITIDSSERVGIANTSPSEKLSVHGAIQASNTGNFSSGNQGVFLDYNSSTGIGTIRTAHWGSAFKPLEIHTHTLSILTGVGSATEKMRVTDSGNVGIGTTSPQSKLHILGPGGGTTTDLRICSPDNNISRVTVAEDTSGASHGGFFEYRGNDLDKTVLGVMNSGTDTDVITYTDSGNVGIGTNSPSGKFQIEGGRAGIISTDHSWGQFRVANSSVAEVGVTVMNGAVSNEFLSDGAPTSSNKFVMGINTYNCGTDTWGIGHGNVGDSVMHIDGSGNFGFGPHSDNPHGYFEILKQKSGTGAPSDYELLFTLNSKGYFGNGYKAGIIRFCAGDTASGQDNFYAGIGCKTLTGTNNQEEGSLDFHVKNTAESETLAMQIIGKAGTGIAGGGQHVKSVLFRYQGIAIDRVWGGYPGISVLNSSDAGTNQSEFRFHGTNSSSAAYPSTSGSDFSVNVRVDGTFIQTSDRRAKTNITTIDNALSKVKQLTGKRFQRINRKNDAQEHLSKNGYKLGFIGQEIEDIIPEAVVYHAAEDDGTENWNSAYGVDYGSVVALLTNAIKEQDTVIQDLKSRIEALEG